MYIAVRADLTPGLQMAQAVHAAFHFADEHPDMVSGWLNASNFLVVVSVPGEAALVALQDQADAAGITSSLVREPDIDDQATALCLEPGPAAKRLCSQLPLALREKVPV
jgi:peptidyl-tRNA hydrolase